MTRTRASLQPQTVDLVATTGTFRGVREVLGPNYRAVQAWVEVTRDGQPVAQLYPEKRLYASQDAAFTEPAIVHGLLRDFYASLGEVQADRATWTLRLHVKPFVSWIWADGLQVRFAITDTAQRVSVVYQGLGGARWRHPGAAGPHQRAEGRAHRGRVAAVMDATRATYTAQGVNLVRTDLFPDIAIGDAPLIQR